MIGFYSNDRFGFKCNIDVSVIKNVITEYEDKRKNSPVVQ